MPGIQYINKYVLSINSVTEMYGRRKVCEYIQVKDELLSDIQYIAESHSIIICAGCEGGQARELASRTLALTALCRIME